ncbi:MAG: ammonium transporter [Nitrososphaerota archaeon]|nr:ammonium transporter [Nitrososphaerota archaeon]
MPFDTGDTAFMLIATSLVMLMTPGLAFFYGGLVGRKNVLTIMIQSFVSMAIVDIIWFTIGFSLSFSGGAGAIYGNLNWAFLQNIGPNTPFAGDPKIPLYAFMVYQMMFAIITPALISGAFTNRVSFKAYIIFLVAWSLLVYIPFVHMIWGGGLLATWGVKDFAGGIVVHALAGFAALAAVLFVGARRIKESGPHNVPLVALGTGLLWFGWYGFNAGSELSVDPVTVTAFLNTDLAASVAATVWLAMAWIFEKKPKFLGLLTGAVAGLATITPAAGFVSPSASIVIGLLAGIVCYGAIYLKNHMKWDDALDVWGVHGVGGVLGALLLGVFASTAFNPNGANGLLAGNPHFLGVQALAVAIAVSWAFTFTYAMLWLIDKVTPVRVSSSIEDMGLDSGIYGEVAYDDTMEESDTSKRAPPQNTPPLDTARR